MRLDLDANKLLSSVRAGIKGYINEVYILQIYFYLNFSAIIYKINNHKCLIFVISELIIPIIKSSKYSSVPKMRKDKIYISYFKYF